MGRKKKIDQSSNFSVLKMEKQVANTPVCRCRNNKWVNWGRKNLYPQDLLNLYSQSPTLKACVSFAVQALVGNGIDWDRMQVTSVQVTANYEYGFEELLRRVSLDYFVYGSFALQIIKNRDNRTYSFWHVPMEFVRCSPRDEDGKINSYWICSDWSTTASTAPVEVDSLVMRPDEDWNLKSGVPYLYCYETYTPQNTYYSSPIWSQAIKAVMSEIEMIQFDLRSASNVFCPAGALSLPPVSDESQKQAIINNIQSMFTSADGAQQLLIAFREDADDNPIQFTPFVAHQDNVDLFSTSNDRNINRILSTFGISSRSLIGYPEENVGFNSEGALLETAFNLYNTLSGNHSRQCIVGVLNQMLKANGIDVEIVLKPLSFLGDENSDDTDTTAPEQTDDTSESNIIEPKTDKEK